MRKIIFLVSIAFGLVGCNGLVVDEKITAPICPPGNLNTNLCINNPQSPCCDQDLD